MAARTPNDRLARLMADAGFDSHKAFARAVLEESRLAGEPLRRCDHTYVARWLDGMVPRGKTPSFIASALGRKLRRTVSPTEFGMATAGGAMSPDLGLTYPESIAEGAENIIRLWRADLDESSLVLKSKIDPKAWGEASLRWLVNPEVINRGMSSSGAGVGESDVNRFRVTTDVFSQLDNRYGGGHARQALVQYLATDGERLLRGKCTDVVRQNLLKAVAEATLLAAWMSYDSGLHSLAQRYFIQALSLAQAGDNRLLAASILDAMSHQATFVGRYREAVNLARAARTGTQALATPTLTAHFLAMEARALARLGDARACDLALSEAVTAFERRRPEDDPEWIQYFDDAELSAEFGHCFRDLGRPVDASRYADQCLGTIDDGVYLRSDFFATMVLADSHLNAGESERACLVALQALKTGEELRSARCVSYLREFRERLTAVGKSSTVTGFHEQARESRLWRIASSPSG
ncbi:XRE family transcriptional regulator [Actinomadura montaniterrae]|uniref:XRE family transcriptional regulator n=2 Tax=Actinomadura montaniterrae TaxID=1803903 RepID=A0A6L3WBN7_9ACTN|nr:XRE family transcriptional regulator [Actinomadura montaniterrae]